MSYRLTQLSPRISTRGINVKITVPSPWSEPQGSSSEAEFLRSWLEYDSDLDLDDADRGFSWGTVSGLALAVGVSASFWVGLGWMVSRIWR